MKSISDSYRLYLFVVLRCSLFGLIELRLSLDPFGFRLIVQLGLHQYVQIIIRNQDEVYCFWTNTNNFIHKTKPTFWETPLLTKLINYNALLSREVWKTKSRVWMNICVHYYFINNYNYSFMQIYKYKF